MVRRSLFGGLLCMTVLVSSAPVRTQPHAVGNVPAQA